MSQVTGSMPATQSNINWSDYNYPPCLHLVHFDLSELRGTIKRFALNVYLSFVIIICVLLINSKTPEC